MFGEMAPVDRHERAADAVALAGSEVLGMRMKAMAYLRKRVPRKALKRFEKVSRILSERGRVTTQSIGAGPVHHAA
jgi:hypothetical protein